MVEFRREHVKCVILGDSCVGKTSMLNTYLNGSFNPSMGNTIGACYWEKRILIDEKPCNISFWDTAGQERYRAITSAHHLACSFVLFLVCGGHSREC